MAQVKDLLVQGQAKFLRKAYFQDQIVSNVAQGTAPLVVASSTVVSNLNSDYLDGYHASGLFTALSANSTLSITIGGTTLTSSINAATVDGKYISNYYTKSEADDRFVNVTGDTMRGNLSFSNSGTEFRGINYGTMGDNDQWRIGGAATGSNSGYMEIATADDGTEPIYVRQYTGVFASLTRTLALLDGSGNTIIPGNVGIGTTNPSYKLEVIGDAKVGALVLFDINSSNSTKKSYWSIYGWDERLSFTKRNSSNVYQADYMTIIYDSGNVGIGTTSPSAKLHVVGDIYTTVGFKKKDSSDSYVLLGGGGHKLESSLSVNYANIAGNADKLDNINSTGFYRFSYISNLQNKDLNYANNQYGSWNYGDDNTQKNTPTTTYGCYLSWGDLASSDTSTTRNQTAQIGIDCWNDLGRMYVRARQAGNRDVTSIGSWRTVAFTTDIPAVTNYYWANVKISSSSNAYTTPQFGEVTIYDGTNSCLVLKTKSAGAYAYLAAYNTGGGYGADVVLHSGSAMVLGAGESAAAMYSNNVDSLQGSENLYLTADGDVKIFTNCDSISNRKNNITFSSNGSIVIYGSIDALDSNGIICYKPSSWTGVSSSQLGIGTVATQTVIRSSNTNLLHYKHGSGTYTILDSNNYGGYSLPLSGGTMTGSIILKGGTSANMTYGGNVHPYIRFDNSDSSQNISFIFTDWDDYRAPAGIKLVGNQGGEWFEVVGNIYAAGYYKTNGTSVSYNGHTHDERYYTESEVNSLLAGKANSSHSHSYLPLSGGNMTGNIGYAGSQGTYSMIRFLDNVNNNWGAGISIGAGGLTIIGAGESASSVEATVTDRNTESLYLSADDAIYLLCNAETMSNGYQMKWQSGALTVSGTITATHFYESSDITLKTNFSKISTTIEQISNLPIFDFSWKKDLTSRNTGTSAQAVQAIFPNIVTESNNTLKLDYGVLGTASSIIIAKEVLRLKEEIRQLKQKLGIIE